MKSVFNRLLTIKQGLPKNFVFNVSIYKTSSEYWLTYIFSFFFFCFSVFCFYFFFNAAFKAKIFRFSEVNRSTVKEE